MNCDRALTGRPIFISGPFKEALRQQEHIGWCSMLQGYLAKDWQRDFCQTYVPLDKETPAEKTKGQTTMER
jgi:hypothetical protein